MIYWKETINTIAANVMQKYVVLGYYYFVCNEIGEREEKVFIENTPAESDYSSEEVRL